MPSDLLPVATGTLAPIADPQALLLRAVEQNVSIDTLERLLALRATLRAEAAEAAFFAALAAFQGECPTIPKTKSAGQGGFSYKYAPLDQIVATVGPLLQRHGLSYTVDTVIEDTNLVAICTIHHVAGHSLASTFRVPIDKAARMNDTQKVGSASTYAKRYAFTNGLGILTGDEDTDAQQPKRPLPSHALRTNAEQGKAIEAAKRVAQQRDLGAGESRGPFADPYGSAGPDPTPEEMAELFPEPNARRPVAAQALEAAIFAAAPRMTSTARLERPTEPEPREVEPTPEEIGELFGVPAERTSTPTMTCDLITAAQHKALEAAIVDYAKAWGQNPKETRAKLKNVMGKEYGVEHFPDLKPEQYEAILRFVKPRPKYEGDTK